MFNHHLNKYLLERSPNKYLSLKELIFDYSVYRNGAMASKLFDGLTNLR
jgi:hypothetical protein